MARNPNCPNCLQPLKTLNYRVQNDEGDRNIKLKSVKFITPGTIDNPHQLEDMLFENS